MTLLSPSRQLTGPQEVQLLRPRTELWDRMFLPPHRLETLRIQVWAGACFGSLKNIIQTGCKAGNISCNTIRKFAPSLCFSRLPGTNRQSPACRDDVSLPERPGPGPRRGRWWRPFAGPRPRSLPAHAAERVRSGDPAEAGRRSEERNLVGGPFQKRIFLFFFGTFFFIHKLGKTNIFHNKLTQNKLFHHE